MRASWLHNCRLVSMGVGVGFVPVVLILGSVVLHLAPNDVFLVSCYLYAGVYIADLVYFIPRPARFRWFSYGLSSALLIEVFLLFELYSHSTV